MNDEPTESGVGVDELRRQGDPPSVSVGALLPAASESSPAGAWAMWDVDDAGRRGRDGSRALP